MRAALKALGRGFFRAVVILFGLLFLWALATSADPVPEEPDHRQAEIDSMLDFYGCWPPGERPEAKPTHAVVTYRDGAPSLVSIVLGRRIWRHPEDNPGMAVHGFCGEAVR